MTEPVERNPFAPTVQLVDLLELMAGEHDVLNEDNSLARPTATATLLREAAKTIRHMAGILKHQQDTINATLAESKEAVRADDSDPA